MQISEKPATEAEIKQKFRGISFFELGRRRLATAEAKMGVVEVLSFDVLRVWKLFTCSGPPCCPNQWLVQISEDEFAQLESWYELGPTREGMFPGQHVVARRWPKTSRLLSVQISGSSVEAKDMPPEESDGLIGQRRECAVFDKHLLPLHLQELVKAK